MTPMTLGAEHRAGAVAADGFPQWLRWTLRAFVLATTLSCPAFAAAMAWSLPADLRQRTWVESNGRDFRLADVDSPLVVMTMAYTACKKICSNTSLVLGEIQRRFDVMGQAAEFVVVSYDPRNDSPADWQDYRMRRGLQRATWHFLTGDAVSTRVLARQLDLDFWTYHEHIVHDFRIVLFDSHWNVIGEVDWSSVDRLPEILRESLATTRP